MDKQLRKDGFITVVSLTIINALNYGLNIILGRWLGPELFAEAHIIATIVLVISFLGVAIQMNVAKGVAMLGDHPNEQAKLVRAVIKKVLKVSIIISIFLYVCHSLLVQYLSLSSSIPILFIILGLPCYLVLSARRGYYQGVQNFSVYSITFIVETLLRLIITIFGLIILSEALDSWAISMVAFAFLASFVGSYYYAGLYIPESTDSSDHHQVNVPFWRGLLIIGIYELSQILINNFDVILVKHFFSAMDAGMYASIALIGRIVYFGTWTIVTLLFPKVIEKEVKGESHKGLFYGSLVTVFMGGFLVTLFCLWQGDWLLSLLFGESYQKVAFLLWQYAFATTVFATANVFAYYYLSLGRYLPVILSLLAGCLQIILINGFHSSLTQVVFVQIGCMSFLLATMIVYHFFYRMSFISDNKIINHKWAPSIDS